MAEKDTKQQNTDNKKTGTSTDETTGKRAVVPNPFEDGISQLTSEQEENIEQFKESQTERD